MSNDHPLHMMYKMVTPETTLYSYHNACARVEVTVSHGEADVWYLTTRIITLEERSFISDILWKCPKSTATDVDWAFSVLTHHINGGFSPKDLTEWFFNGEWGCAVLDELSVFRPEVK